MTFCVRDRLKMYRKTGTKNVKVYNIVDYKLCTHIIKENK